MLLIVQILNQKSSGHLAAPNATKPTRSQICQRLAIGESQSMANFVARHCGSKDRQEKGKWSLCPEQFMQHSLSLPGCAISWVVWKSRNIWASATRKICKT